MAGRMESALDLIKKGVNISRKTGFAIEKTINTEKLSLLNRNAELSNLYKGRTCFILGNGPSLKEEKDLSKLKTEIVFTVNQFYRSELFDVVSPNYHLIVDPLFFNLSEQIPCENDTLERIKNLSNYNGLKLILPLSGREYIESNSIGTKEMNYYVDSRYQVYPGFDCEIKMDSLLPVIRNVVQTAIYCAIYMGFKHKRNQGITK